MAATVSSSRGCEAKIKPEYLVSNELLEPAEKRSRIDNGDTTIDGEKKKLSKRDKKKEKGQNKHRPRTAKFTDDMKLCQHYFDGVFPEVNCPNEKCPFMHDVEKFWQSKTQTLDRECPTFTTYGKCPRGLVCIFASSHVDVKTFRNIVNEELWNKMKSQYEATHRILLDKNVQQQLRKKKYDFKSVDDIVEGVVFPNKSKQGNNVNGKATIVADTETTIKTSGAVTDEDLIAPKLDEIKKIDWKNKLYLSPLTTVGNLPFRRLCVEYGADITCSEMSLASSIIQGNLHEFALHRRHPSEKCWGVQLCANNPWVAAKAARVLYDIGIDYDFVDLNVGCPLDNIFKQGAGSGLMCRTNKYQSVVKSMTSVLSSVGKPFTVKMRTGIKVDKNFAHTLIPFCRDTGVEMVTIHGRTREQRYLKLADWNYIAECAKVAEPMPLFGNGDILSWEDYEERKKLSNVTGVVIGRGALMKPWIFQEIKEQRHIDLSSQERLELIRKYCNYGLDHWGSDAQGVETTRRFLLEWLSFYYRYIPFGILEAPQKVNERPPKYHGRDEMETLLSSSNVNDWIRISEMFLGPVPESFEFLPKHKSNAWEGG